MYSLYGLMQARFQQYYMQWRQREVFPRLSNREDVRAQHIPGILRADRFVQALFRFLPLLK